ncbi:Polyketide cyclase/dehydrase [Trema orientale]|uniref:Polyketide cyclase/dehydrase n=1 Tax=Trema orientale TaxID=63057 RepID=A0A2P5FST2_TREOI|nr:Polyketide cyclase/dehydrase [Trema orientale]
MDAAAHQVVDDHDQQVLQQPKWEGEASTELKHCKAEQVWPLLEDFFGLDKWFPTLSICLPVEGLSGQVGCVRFCAGFKTPVDPDDQKEMRVNWTKQKLLSVDPTRMTFSYSIVDGNVGFNSYVSALKVVPKGEDGCLIEWRYEVEPVEGWKLEDLDTFIGNGLEVMARRMEVALQAYNKATKCNVY